LGRIFYREPFFTQILHHVIIPRVKESELNIAATEHGWLTGLTNACSIGPTRRWAERAIPKKRLCTAAIWPKSMMVFLVVLIDRRVEGKGFHSAEEEEDPLDLISFFAHFEKRL
jgi:hypothetical protein